MHIQLGHKGCRVHLPWEAPMSRWDFCCANPGNHANAQPTEKLVYPSTGITHVTWKQSSPTAGKVLRHEQNEKMTE